MSSRRASLPGADELFRKTSGESPAEATPPPDPPKSTNLQVAKDTNTPRPRHEEKITFYCTPEELTRIERARLNLRADHRIAADRGKIVRAAVAEALDDLERRGMDSSLARHLRG